MELDELRLILKNSSVDLWGLIDTAISVAIVDHGIELRSRRDAIVEKLYVPLLSSNSNSDGNYEIMKRIEGNIDDDCKLKTEENSNEEDLEISKILRIKNHFEIPNQRTDIGRHVNKLRKHSSNEVRRLVKLLIRRWKDTVDEWVKLNTLVEDADEANISNDSSSYCDHKHSVEKKNNISPSSKRLREDYVEEHYAKIGRSREVDLEDVGKPKNSVVVNSISGFEAKYW
ncbi:probable mediator of RNA polymerase II transcription subunit 26c isoform X2 [Solanum pennellii]|uniref:Probable mediator of RNA polymerase II transcription subunit 26c isoform X2 n=1 Tax=Solanum pennellii TaxID=28526 RepID=A0ABM1V8L7_SOLPN|nr:probable mediator of RNA polymerase II transcription subunit 26c isoform X2 [Solanum pennellii]